MVVANDECNFLSTGTISYNYQLKCGAKGVTGVFYCDSTCRNCKIDQLDASVDGECSTILDSRTNADPESTLDVTFTGLCEPVAENGVEQLSARPFTHPLNIIIIVIVVAILVILPIIAAAVIIIVSRKTIKHAKLPGETLE